MSVLVRFSRVCGVVLLSGVMATSLGSCQLARNQLTYDRAATLDRQDFRDALSPRETAETAGAPVPDFQPVLSTPEELRLPAPLVSVSVNQTVGLRDLLFELASQAGVDLELDPQIHGSVIFTAHEKPFDEVVDRICAMSGLRYTYKNGVLNVKLDRPYIKNYSVDYLNISRTGTSSIETSVSVGSETGSGGGSGGSEDSTSSGSTSGGSESSIKSKYDGDAWKELDDNLKHLLAATDTDVMLATLSDPLAMPLNPTPPPAPVDPNAAANGQVAPPPLPGSPQVGAMPAAAAPVLNITPSADPVVPNAPSTYSISRQTGIVTVFASERQQIQVEKFLNEFRRRVTTQVLIEAKVLQVELTDEYATGIDWGAFKLSGIVRLNPTFPAPALEPTTTNGFTALIGSNGTPQGLIEAVSRFGTVRTLSSPRITAVNNQPAVVNVAQNIIYFSIKNGTTTTSTGSGSTTAGGVETETKSVPEGVLLNVIPSANPDTGEIFLNVRPTVSKFVKFVNDPAPQLLGLPSSVVSQVPQMLTQEMESFLRIQSGQTMIMGGLMQDGNTVSESGIPLAGDLPFVGNLFKNHGDKVKKSELVIFLTATIVPGSNVHDADRDLYKTFGMDRRPAKM